MSIPPATEAAISEQIFVVAGLECTVYGLEELWSDIEAVACLWLLHPRLGDRNSMRPIATTMIRAWNNVLDQRRGSPCVQSDPTWHLLPGLIAVSIDHRNHGTRLVKSLANLTWRDGNKLHALDMFSIYREWADCLSTLR